MRNYSDVCYLQTARPIIFKCLETNWRKHGLHMRKKRFSRFWRLNKGWGEVETLTSSAFHPAVFVRAIPEADLIGRPRWAHIETGANSGSALLTFPPVCIRWSISRSALACDGGRRLFPPQGGGSRHRQLCASAGRRQRGKRWVWNPAGLPWPSSVSIWLWRSSAAPAPAGRRVQGQKISRWEGQKGLAFLQDVQLVDGELVVPWPGLYYVYAQTYFRHTHSLEDAEEEGQEEGDRGRPLLQYVYKKVSVCLSNLWLLIYLISKTNPNLPVLSPTRWTPTQFPSCWWRQAEPPAGLGDPSFPCIPPTRGGCSRSGAATASLWLWPTPPLWTWTRRAASLGRFWSARCDDLRKRAWWEQIVNI